MKKPDVSFTQVLLAGGLLTFASASFAAYQDFSWNNAPGTVTAGSSATVLTGVTVKATAWSNTNGLDGTNAGVGTTASNKYVKQTLNEYTSGTLTGLSVYSNNEVSTTTLNAEATQPNHATDNQHAQEFILFEFSEAVSLNQLRISYPGSSTAGTASTSDMTILAYTGADLTTAQMETLLLNSDSTALDTKSVWGYENHLTANTSSSPNDPTNFAGAPASRFWLVGAYNEHLGGTAGAMDDTRDFIKLAGLGGSYCAKTNTGADCTPPPPPCTTPGGCTPSIPEPSSITLAALGILGGIRRWKRKTA